jgi:hypothetical protein
VLTRLAFVCLLACGASAKLHAAPPTAPTPKATKSDPVAELVEKLNAPIDDPIQPKGMTVEEYLAKLSKALDIKIVLDEEAYKAHNGHLDAVKDKLSFEAPKGIRLHRLLSLVCVSLGGNNSNESRRIGTVIRDGQLVILPTSAALELQGVKESVVFDETTYWPFWITVWVIANDEPLSTVLRRMVEVYDVNVVITSEAAKLAESRITNRLLNVPLETAIQSLADQCGLGIFVRNNVILVTTPEHAKGLAQEQRSKYEQDLLQAQREAEWKRRAAERDLAGLLHGTPPVIVLRQKLVDSTVDEKVTIDVHNATFARVVSNLTGAGFSITIDPVAAKKTETLVTAKMRDVSCEAAVKQLAELARLRAVRMDNSLFVTTPEKAERLTPPPSAKKPKPKKDKAP